MDEKLIEKMLGQALKQYGRNVATDPLSPGEKEILKLALQERRIEEPNEGCMPISKMSSMIMSQIKACSPFDHPAYRNSSIHRHLFHV